MVAWGMLKYHWLTEAIQYIARFDKKGTPERDLEKALYRIQCHLDLIRGEGKFAGLVEAPTEDVPLEMPRPTMKIEVNGTEKIDHNEKSDDDGPLWPGEVPAKDSSLTDYRQADTPGLFAALDDDLKERGFRRSFNPEIEIHEFYKVFESGYRPVLLMHDSELQEKTNAEVLDTVRYTWWELSETGVESSG
jgi:hypothetical protein